MGCTPGFLRQEAIRQVIGAIHQGHVGGSWSLETAETRDGITTLTFAIGVVYPDQPDTRQYVRVSAWEVEPPGHANTCGLEGHPSTSHLCRTAGGPVRYPVNA